jgi:hypothetical protein
MPARKMRVELFDSEGNRYTINFEGDVTRDKALRLLDLVDLLGGAPVGGADPNTNPTVPKEVLSKYNKMGVIVQKHFPLVWFSSREVQAIYEQEFKEPIGLSTVATYLARMTTRGIILKNGSSNNLKYRLSLNIHQVSVKQKTL